MDDTFVHSEPIITTFEGCLELFRHRYEKWIHHSTPELNRPSAEWLAAGESRPERPKTQQLAGKVVPSEFWDLLGILYKRPINN